MAGLSSLPQVDAVLRDTTLADVTARLGHATVRDAVRRVIDDARATVRAGGSAPDRNSVATAARQRLLRAEQTRLRRVVNATGVVLHTNLGRAPLSAAATEAAVAAAGATNLEYDLVRGERGSRTRDVGALAAEACGAEAATVVNNGAAALLLVLAALAADRETIVSRGELIEIGGSYRLPDIMEVAGTRLVEVGTTNRTRLEDYGRAVRDTTALLLKVHPSNFALIGFTEAASAQEVGSLAREHELPFVYDVGSGLLSEAEGPLATEPSVAAAIAAGADLVLCSGDKLLGGPQAGIVAGRRDLVEACARHPLARAVRIDKLQRAALEATLREHRRRPGAPALPVWRMLQAAPAALQQRATTMADSVGAGAVAAPTAARVGGGALPDVELESWGVVVATPRASAVAARLRTGAPPIVARVEDARVVLDLRTIDPSDDASVTARLRAVIATP